MDVRERIQLKADELFRRYGIRSITMDDIAQHLSISKKTIYQFFADKNELVLEVMKREITETEKICGDYHSQATNAIEEVFMTMDYIDQVFLNLNPSLFFDMAKFHPQSWAMFMEHKDKFLIETVRKNLVRGIEEALYRPEIDVDVLARFRMESAYMIFNLEAFPPSKYNLGRVSHELIEHFLYGIVLPRGYKLIEKYKNERTNKPTVT